MKYKRQSTQTDETKKRKRRISECVRRKRREEQQKEDLCENEPLLRTFSQYPLLNFLISLPAEEFLILETVVAVLLQLELNTREKEILAVFLGDIGFAVKQLGRQKHRQRLVIEEVQRAEIFCELEALTERLASLESKFGKEF